MGDALEFEAAESLLPLLLDEMTSLYHRAYVLHQLQAEILRARRYSTTLSLMLLAIDGIDRLQAAYGEFVGTKVCVAVAEIFRQFARDTDVAGRYSAGVFCLLMPLTDRPGAEALAQRLRERIAETPVASANGKSVFVTCSIGLTSYSAAAETVQDFLRTGESALAEARAAGGNCFCFC